MIQKPVPWPNGARVACVNTFDMDADSLVHLEHPEDSSSEAYSPRIARLLYCDKPVAPKPTA